MLLEEGNSFAKDLLVILLLLLANMIKIFWDTNRYQTQE